MLFALEAFARQMHHPIPTPALQSAAHPLAIMQLPLPRWMTATELEIQLFQILIKL